MPNSLTHNYISDEILKRLDAPVREVILRNKKLFDIGSLGPDVIMGLMWEKDEEKRLSGELLHTDHIYEGIFNSAEYLLNNPDDEKILVYFLGFLTHYGTDSTVHPFVYEYIANRLRQKYDPVLDNCLHTIVETEMDTYIDNYCLHGKNANSYWRFNWRKNTRDTVERYFNVVNKDTYHLKINRAEIDVSMFLFRLMMFLCQRHNNGRTRYSFVKFVDKRLKAEHLLMSALRPRSLDTRYDYLNMEKTPYSMIFFWKKSEIVNFSFPELIELAIEKGTRLIELALKHINGGEKLNLEDFKISFNGDINKEWLAAHGYPVFAISPTERPLRELSTDEMDEYENFTPSKD